MVFLCAMASNVEAQKFVQESFEDGMEPAGWTLSDNWIIGDVDATSSQFFTAGEHSTYLMYNDDGLGSAAPVSDASATSSAVDMTGVASATLLFESYFIGGGYGTGELAEVRISTDAGATWTKLQDITVATQGGVWADESISLDAYSGENIMIQFWYDDGGDWNFGLALDDVLVINPLTNDVLLGGFTQTRFVKQSNNIAVPVTNLGVETVTSLEMSWSNGGNTYTETITGLDIPTFGSAMVQHPTDYSAFSVGEYEGIDVTISKVNGVDDLDAADNSFSTADRFSVVEEDFVKYMVVEEATGTWCPWCPRGDVFMNQMEEDYPDNFIGIAVHNEDPMAIAEHDSGITGITGGGWPNSTADRSWVGDPSALPGLMEQRINNASPVDIEATANYVTDENKIEVSMTSNFYTVVTDRQFRFSAIVIEDGVTGTGNDYAQANNYAGGGQGPMGGFENLPNPVPASQMVYNHVSRVLVGGFDGMVGDFPAMVDNGTSVTHSMTIDVDTTWNRDELHIVCLVTDTETGEIHNGLSIAIDGQFTPTENVELADFNLFPNPAQTSTELTFSLEEKQDVNVMIYNSLGQTVWTKAYGELSGNQSFNLDVADLNTGAYTLVIQLDATEFVAKQLHVVK